MTNLHIPVVPAVIDEKVVVKGLQDYSDHLTEIETIFNDYARDIRLGVKIDVSGAIQYARSNPAAVLSFFTREDDSGVLHGTQLMTAMDCIAKMIDSPGQNGVVIGAMQSGKTTTSLALQFAGPIIYTLTGRRVYPIYMATSHTSQEDQTKIELNHFLSYYSLVKVERDLEAVREGVPLLPPPLDPLFHMGPTIDCYRRHVLRYALKDYYQGPRLEDFIARRVGGRAVQEMASLCMRAHQEGFEALLTIDEPQYGASDRQIENEDGIKQWRACVLQQLFSAIDDAIGQAGKCCFIGLSATPYAIHEIDAVWVVRQILTSSYCGFNYFGGRVLSDGVDVTPPLTLGLSTFAERFDLPFFSKISFSAYGATSDRFAKFAKKVGFEGTQLAYQAEVRDTVRKALLAVAKQESDIPVGICLRLTNNNINADAFVRDLKLEEIGIDVINYFGHEYSGVSVKRAIRQRKNPSWPFVIVVTNRARMGDAFPGEVRWFMDFAAKTADLNALLQGLLGRACGYHKKTSVVLSDDNAAIVADYARSGGKYIYKTSRDSVVVGGYRRGAPTNLIKLRRTMDDPLVQQFFDRLQTEVVDPWIVPGSPKISPKRIRGKDKFRTGPILRIADELGLFEHLESDAVVTRLFPQIPGGFRIVRATDKIFHSRDTDKVMEYVLDDNGDCRFTFRQSKGDAEHAGVSSRGYGERDATNRARAGDKLEPQIHLEKFDQTTGQRTDNPSVPGIWRVAMITLPLKEPVRELQSGEGTLPTAQNFFRGLLNDDERMRAGHV